jgi:Fic family protein
MGTTSSKNAISGTRDTIDPKFLEAMERLALYNPKPPEGSFTVEDVAKEWGCENSTAGKKLKKMYMDGELDRLSQGNNKMYYWFKD